MKVHLSASVVVGIALGALAPAAAAHHSDPNCGWGQGVLPDGEALSVTIEGPRWLEDCPGWRVAVRVGGGDEIAITTHPEPAPAPRQQSAQTSERDGARKGRKTRRCKKQRKGARGSRCQRRR